MLQPIRRVVTGHDAQGRSIVVSDGPAQQVEMPFWPGCGVTSPWSTSSAPASNSDDELDKPIKAFPDAGSGGVAFMIMHIAPMSDLEKMTPEQRAAATMAPADFMPEAMKIDMSHSHGMHATDTLDLIVVLKGEITAIVEDQRVTLRETDTLIQRGVNHSWENHGTETALVMSAVVDAKPLDRIRKPLAREVEPERF